jgi:cobaltochelatase CobN
MSPSAESRPAESRHRTVRPDGKQIYLVPKKAHLIVCARGCCCGRTDRGNPEVPIEYYKQEYQRRKIRKHVQLTMSGCIGPCPMLNVVQLIFDGRPIWFQSVNTKAQVDAIYRYLDAMLAADAYLTPPVELSDYVFDYYRWNHNNAVADMPVASVPLDTGVCANGILYLTHADTDLQSFHSAYGDLPADFCPVEAHSLMRIGNEGQMKSLLAGPGATAAVLVARIHGRPHSVPGFGELVEFARSTRRALVVVSGADGVDPELTALSTVDPSVVHGVASYLQAGGPKNFANCLRFLSDSLQMTGHGYEPADTLPEDGIYCPQTRKCLSLEEWQSRHNPSLPAVGLLFYRAHWTSGNLSFVDALVHEIERQGASALPVFTSSLKCTRDGSWPAAFDWLIDRASQKPLIDVLITTMSFALGNAETGQRSGSDEAVFASLGVPVLQAITSASTRWQWEVSQRGLNPLDTAMNVALPELDGRIITVPISFKQPLEAAPNNGATAVSHYAPVEDRIQRVVGQAMRWIHLRKTSNAKKRIAFVLTNSAGKASRIGNAVGLDAPASLIGLLTAMQAAGYRTGDFPAHGDTLIHDLIDRCSYDETLLTDWQLAHAAGHVDAAQYQAWFQELPETMRQRMEQQWGPSPGTAYVHDNQLALAGLEFENVFVALQPPRGYGMDANAIYHTPDLPPTHHYYALYRWLRDVWKADAIVHLGKHGTLEWLPGKSLGLSAECFPDAFLGDLPLIYPFIINDPGEGSQAKRRSHAVIIDHLVPPMTTADIYGPLAELSLMVDEYYQVEQLDPQKLPLLQQQIWERIRSANLDEDLKQVMTRDHGHTHEWDEGTTSEGTPLSLASMQGTEVAHVLEELDAYLCELAGAQIRDGLHTLGLCPADDQLVDLLLALTRIPNLECPSLKVSIAATFGLDCATLSADLGGRATEIPLELTRLADRPLVTNGDISEVLDELARSLVLAFAQRNFAVEAVSEVCQAIVPAWQQCAAERPSATADVIHVLQHMAQTLVPSLARTDDEIGNLLLALEGKHVVAGPSGAPTRGMAHVLPTGRNFYSVDPRALPSATAWRVGQELAREVLQRHLSETGNYPETVGISIWGTSAMRTHGDDVAEVFALLGVRPRWQRESRRMSGVEIIPLAELGRPRIDVVVRISGFFRDAFPHLIRYLDEAVQLVAQLDEPPDQNFVRKHYLAEVEPAIEGGTCEFDADRRARYRVFGSKPGSYGAGILPLIDAQNWHDHADFAQAYVNWGGYAYTADEQGIDARDIFRERLGSVQVALHNQDNREHDIFDSDDYLQFHGGMIATIRALTGRKPKHYFGDSHDPSKPAVRDLKAETLRVFRTRVVNPKWIESIQRHGYKGGLELSATVDYLFGYDATADVVDDWMYQQVAEIYALDPSMQEFLEQSNPWAMKAISERLLEAAQRGMWREPDADTLSRLGEILQRGDMLLESRTESTMPKGK